MFCYIKLHSIASIFDHITSSSACGNQINVKECLMSRNEVRVIFSCCIVYLCTQDHTTVQNQQLGQTIAHGIINKINTIFFALNYNSLSVRSGPIGSSSDTSTRDNTSILMILLTSTATGSMAHTKKHMKPTRRNYEKPPTARNRLLNLFIYVSLCHVLFEWFNWLSQFSCIPLWVQDLLLTMIWLSIASVATSPPSI